MGLKQKEDWDLQVGLAYSLVDKTLNIMLKEILAQRRWKLLDIYKSDEECFANLSIGHANLLIIDDTILAPGSFILREQLFREIPCLTPTIVICSEHNRPDMLCMRSMGRPAIVNKPLTPQKFLDAFDDLIKLWNEKSFRSLREAATQLTKGNKAVAFKHITEEVRKGTANSLASTFLALHYRNEGDLVMTEKVLIKAFVAGQHDMNIILPLIDLYLFGGSPNKALMLIAKANREYENPNFLCIDAIQAHLMLNELQESVIYFQQMIDNEYYANVAKHYLPRILYSSGLIDAFDKAIRFRIEKFDEYQRAWHTLSDQDAERRSKQYQVNLSTKKQKDRELRSRAASKREHISKETTLDQSLYQEVGKPLFRKDA
ncbi:MAG: hypothetical protein HRU19_25865 [Pseudobacteriovorax sp.]|nr:hypothetical protein [Pseudobacteriovorax sp.]